MVAELPEALLDHLQGGRVVEGLEGSCRLGDHGPQPGDQGEIEGLRNVLQARQVVAVAIELHEHEPAGVEDLHGKPFADLEDPRVKGRVGAEPGTGGPVAHRVRGPLDQEIVRGHDVALGFRHLLAVGIEDPARQHDVVPGDLVLVHPRLDDGVEGPGPDDVVRLRPDVHREQALEQLAVDVPVARICGVSDEVAQVSMTSGSAEKPAGLVALILGEARGGIGHGIHRQRSPGRHRSDGRTIGLAVLAEPGTTPGKARRSSAAGNAPVLVQPFNPVGVAGLHVGRVPLDLVALRQEGLPVLEHANEPLPGRNELQRAVALFVELDDLVGRLRVTHQRRPLPPGKAPLLGEQLGHPSSLALPM